MIDDQTKISILFAAAENRKKSVIEYQINIDNYKLAICEIEKNYADDKDMISFKSHIEKLLNDNIREQKKEKIMFDVILSQLGEV